MSGQRSKPTQEERIDCYGVDLGKIVDARQAERAARKARAKARYERRRRR